MPDVVPGVWNEAADLVASVPDHTAADNLADSDHAVACNLADSGHAAGSLGKTGTAVVAAGSEDECYCQTRREKVFASGPPYLYTSFQ